jgi:uncharacterized protein (TIGR00369 family)
VPLTFPFPLKDRFNHLLGVQVNDWGPGHVTLELAVREEFENLAKLVHGGVIATLIDTACNFAGAWTEDSGERRIPVTLTLTTNFIAGARKGPLSCTARRTGGGKTTFMADAEVKDGDGRLVATGQAVLRFVGAPRDKR